MKNKINKSLGFLLPVLSLALTLGIGGCRKDVSSTPVIKSVRNYTLQPGDSVLTSAGPGQWIVISGSNLKGALQIVFDGVPSSFNDALFTDTAAVVLIPAVIPFPTVPSAQLNTINYVTTHGQTTFTFPILPPAPSISSV